MFQTHLGNVSKHGVCAPRVSLSAGVSWRSAPKSLGTARNQTLAEGGLEPPLLAHETSKLTFTLSRAPREAGRLFWIHCFDASLLRWGPEGAHSGSRGPNDFVGPGDRPL